MIETQRGIRMKLGVLVILASTAWLPSAAAEASKILFKSEVAGTDLPFSDAALVGHALHLREGRLNPRHPYRTRRPQRGSKASHGRLQVDP